MQARPVRPPIAGFMSMTPATHEFLPRATRKALRVIKPATPLQTYTSLDVDLTITDPLSIADPCGDSAYYCTNTVDPAFDLDGSEEFSDSSEADNLFGLTIVEPGHGNVRRWLRGHDIL